MILFHHKSTELMPQLYAWWYLIAVLVFALLTFVEPVYGLVGMGVLLLVASILVEFNADRIWNESLKWRKKLRKPLPWYNRPTKFFHIVNVYILWPFVMLTGIASLVLAYKLVGIA